MLSNKKDNMKKKLKILHSAFFSIYFPAGIQRPASSICSEYRLSSQKGKEKQMGASVTNKNNCDDQPSLFNMPIAIPVEADRDTNDTITKVSTAADATVLKKIDRNLNLLIG